MEIKSEKNSSFENEDRYRLLFENNLAGVFRSEITGKVVEANQTMAEIFGYESPEDLKKTTAHDFYFSRKDREKYIEKLRLNGVLKNHHVKVRRKDGSEAWVIENVQIVKLGGKEYIEGTLIDFTETKNIQHVLQESEQNYKSLIEHTSAGIMIHDEKGDAIYANPAALKLIGVSSLNDLADKNIFSYVLPQYHDKIRTRKDEIKKGIDATFVPMQARMPDGRVIDLETKTNHITYKGKPAIEVVIHDTAIQRQMERDKIRLQIEEETTRELKREIASHIRTRQRLNANQKYVRLLIDSSLDMIFACDQDKKITEFNTSAQHVFGYGLKEVLGKHISMLCANAAECENTFNIVLQQGTYMCETEHIKKDGSKFIALVSSSILKNERGEILGLMSISRDITRIKEAEEQLKKSVHEKEILLKEIHHRVKNNMQVISSILKLQSAYVEDKKTVELLNECRNRISSMAFIHASLYMKKDFANVHFADYVGNIATNLQQSYSSNDKKIELKLDIPDFYMHIDDAIPCGLIINELLSNSFKYAFSDKKTGTIGLSVKNRQENVILAIWDDGKGISKNIDYKNTQSLGLQLVNSLVEQLSGKMELQSKPNEGTKFVIEFNKSK
ncbi:MAG TPA: PAS domain S-box protein [Bacteroidia bacterium]|nr:PAS domain S-box protein [Bacteroidia bacterium]